MSRSEGYRKRQAQELKKKKVRNRGRTQPQPLPAIIRPNKSQILSSRPTLKPPLFLRSLIYLAPKHKGIYFGHFLCQWRPLRVVPCIGHEVSGRIHSSNSLPWFSLVLAYKPPKTKTDWPGTNHLTLSKYTAMIKT